jgi:hypothetical protein
VPAQEGGAVVGTPAVRTAQLGGPGRGAAAGSGHRVAAAPSGKLPSDLLGPVGLEDVLEGARVELVYHNSGVIEGTVAGAEVHLGGLGRSRRGSADGIWGEVVFGAAWSVGNVRQSPENPSPPSQVVVSVHFGQLPVKLKGDFQLGPDQSFERAGLSGDLGGESLRAEVSAADGGLGTTSTRCGRPFLIAARVS